MAKARSGTAICPAKKDVIARMGDHDASGIGFDRITAQLKPIATSRAEGDSRWEVAVTKILSREK